MAHAAVPPPPPPAREPERPERAHRRVFAVAQAALGVAQLLPREALLPPAQALRLVEGVVELELVLKVLQTEDE